MTDAPQGGKGLGKGRLALVAVAVFAAAGAAIYLQNREKKKQAIAATLWQIEHGDEIQSSTAIRELHLQLTTPTEFLEILPYLVHQMDNESEVVREAAVTFVGQWILQFGSRGLMLQKKREPAIVQLCRKAQDVVLARLDDSSPAVRTSVANSLTSIARIGDFDVPPPQLVAAVDDEAETVRIAASQALSTYRQGPEALLPVALRRIPTESPLVATSIASNLGGVDPKPSMLPALIEGLSSENPNVRYIAVTAIGNMGTAGSPALPAVLTLLRKEIDAPQPGPVKGVGPMSVEDITERAAGAVGEICPDTEPPPEAVDVLCEVLKRPNQTAQLAAAGSLGII
ncbi:HEAT repeat domain-containing protein, partial [Singulisphaera rosea]